MHALIGKPDIYFLNKTEWNCKGTLEHSWFDYRCNLNNVAEDLVRYALNMLGDHAKAIDTEEELNKFTVSDPEYMFVGKTLLIIQLEECFQTDK